MKMDKQDSTNVAFVVLISIATTIGGFLFGFDSGVINGTVDGLQTAFDLGSVATGFNVASMLLPAAQSHDILKIWLAGSASRTRQ